MLDSSYHQDICHSLDRLTEHLATRSNVRAGLDAGDGTAGGAVVIVEAILRAVRHIRRVSESNERLQTPKRLVLTNAVSPGGTARKGR
jgi:hypothetical protein